MVYLSATTQNGVARVGASSDGQLGGKDLAFCLWAQENRDKEDGNTDHSGDEDGTCQGYLMGRRLQQQ
jgi:hypothetical protein